MRSSRPLFEFHFDVVQRRIRHEQRAAQFQQHGRLDHLHVPPKVADAIASITEPPAAWPLLHCHLHRFTLRVGKAFTQPVQHAAKDIANVRLDVDALCRVQRQIFDCHDSVHT